MSQATDPRWLSHFLVEIDQHLLTIEPVLGRPDPDCLERSEINLLLREFHSIKGLARAFAATGMEAMAHHAESLLSPVRSGERTFDAAIQDLLIAASDALRDGLAEPFGWQAPSGLIETMLTASAVTVAKDVGDQAFGEPDNCEPWRWLGDDLQTLLAFAELLDELLPEAATAIVAENEDDLREAIDAVIFASARLRLDGIESAAQRVLIKNSAERLAAFAVLTQKAARFGSLVGASCGVPEAARVLQDRLLITLRACLDQALAASHEARPAWLRLCLSLCSSTDLNSPASRLLQDLSLVLPGTVADRRDRDGLLIDGLSVLSAGLDQGSLSDPPMATFRDALREPYCANAEIEGHLRALGLDIRLFSPGPPRRFERLGTLLDGSGATLKEVVIEKVTPAALESLAPLDPLLGQCARRQADSALAVLLLDVDPPGAAAASAREGIGRLSGLDPGRPPGAFALCSRAAEESPEPEAETQVKVPVAVLDKLFGRVGEFFSIGSRLNHLATETDVPDALRRLSEFAASHAPQLQPCIETVARRHRDFTAVEADVGRILSLIHASTLGLRLIPLDLLVGRFPRFVRDTAHACGKQVRFTAETGGIRIDKSMSDMLADPLIHLLRNAIDHGVEAEAERRAAGKPTTARVRLIARQQGNRILMEIRDDGRGIDIERVRQRALASRLGSEDEIGRMSDEQLARFIFTPGFSTKDDVTDVSGRGVGLDVVLVHVTKLGGKIDIATETGRGTSFRLDLPLSAAIQPMLLADTGVQSIGFPEAMVSETLMFPSAGVQFVNGQRAILLRERFLPVFGLTELLRLPPPSAMANQADMPIVLCQWAGQRMAIEVHQILRRGEMLIRKAHPRVAALPGIGGITSMGLDRVVLVLDPEGLFDLARKASVSGLRMPAVRSAREWEGLAFACDKGTSS